MQTFLYTLKAKTNRVLNANESRSFMLEKGRNNATLYQKSTKHTKLRTYPQQEDNYSSLKTLILHY